MGHASECVCRFQADYLGFSIASLPFSFDFFVDDENKTIKHKSESGTNAQTDQISYTHDAFKGPG